MADDLELKSTISATYTSLQSGLSGAVSAIKAAANQMKAGYTEIVEHANKAMEEVRLTTEEKSKSSAHALGELREQLIHVAEAYAVFRGVEFLKGAIEQTLEMGEKLQNLHEKTGISVKDLSDLRYAAGTVGVSLDNVTALVRGLAMHMQQLQQQAAGTQSRLTVAMRDIGVNVAQLKDPMSALSVLADKVAATSDNAAARMRLLGDAQAIFGRGVIQFLPVLAKGSAGIAALKEEAAKYGVELDENTVRAQAEVKEELNKLSLAWEGIKTSLVDSILPVLKIFADELLEVAGDASQAAKDHSLEDWARSAAIAIAELSQQIVELSAFLARHNDLVGVGIAAMGAMALKSGKVAQGAALIALSWKLTGTEGDKAAALMAAGLEKTDARLTETIAKLKEKRDLEQGGGTTAPLPPLEFANKGPQLSAAQIKHQKEQEYQDTVAFLHDELAATESTKADKLKMLEEEVAVAKKLFGDQSKEYRNALAQELNERRDYINQLKAEGATELADRQKMQEGQLKITEAGYKAQLDLKQITKGQELDLERGIQEQIYEVQIQRINDTISNGYYKDKDAYTKLVQEKIDLEQKWVAQKITLDAEIEANNQEITQKVHDQWASVMTEIDSQFSSTIDSILAGTESVTAAFEKMTGDIIKDLIKSGIKDFLEGGKEGTVGGTLFGGGVAGLLANKFGAIGGVLPGGGAAGTAGAPGAGNNNFGLTGDLVSKAFGDAEGEISKTLSNAFNDATSDLSSIFSNIFGSVFGGGGGGGGFDLSSLLGSGLGGLSSIFGGAGAAAGAAGGGMDIASFAGSLAEIAPMFFEKGGIVSAARGMVTKSSGITPALLHPREMVLPANLSDKFQRLATPQQTGETHHHYSPQLTVQALDSKDVASHIAEHGAMLAAEMQRQMRLTTPNLLRSSTR